MRKFYASAAGFLCALFLLLCFSSRSQVPMFHKGTGTGSNTIPMNTAGSHTQQIYTPTDFNTLPISGLITKIYFRNSVAGTSGTYQNFSVAFLQNSMTAFPNNTFLTGFTTALSASSITINGNATAGGWYEIPLTTPFLYDNTQTLIVEIKYTSRTGGMSNPTSSAGAGINKRLSIITAPGPATGNLSSIWGDFGMDVMLNSPCIDPPDAGTAVANPGTPVCGGSPVNLNLTGHTSGLGQTYIWQSGPGSGGPWTDISVSSSVSNHIVNPATTTWYRASVTCGAGNDFSDPVEIVVTPPLPGGTYTINPADPPVGNNFQTFQAALDAMTCGIAGPVVFNVANTVFNNTQILIPQIPGTSNINTITFNGNGATLNATPVSPDRALIRLDGADWIRINNFNLVANSGSTIAWGIHLTNGADNNIINGNNIDVSAVTSTTQSNSAGIVASGSNTSVTTDGEANFNTISNNVINGGYQGIILMASAASTQGEDNVIIGNEVKNWLITGIEVTEQDGIVISGNNIHRTDRTDVNTTISQGIELGDGTINALVNGNRVHDSHTAASTQTGTFYGIFMNATDAPVGSENRIINNLVYKLNSTSGTQYGLYNSGSDGVYYYHNTVILDHGASTGGITRGFFQTTTASNIIFRNNLVYINRGGSGVKYAVYLATDLSSVVSNNNVLYNISTDGTNGIGFFDGTGYTTLLDWQGANSNAFDQQSVSVDPLFLSAATGDYTPMSLQVNDQGAALGVLTDINNNARSATTPDPGAFEFDVASGLNMGAESLVAPAVADHGCYTSAETVTIRIRNSSTQTINFATNPVTVTTEVTGAVVQTLSAIVNSGTLASNATLDVTMTGTLNMTAPGIYTFNASTSVIGDVMTANDAMAPDSRSKNMLLTGAISASPQSICVTPEAPTLNSTGSNGWGSLRWQESTTSGSGFTDIPGGTTMPFTVPAPITQTMYYRLVVACDAATQTSFEVSVPFSNPSITGTTPDAICGTGSATLQATGSGNPGGFNWYSGATGGAPIGNGSPFVTPSISSTTTFYVTATTGGLGANVGLPDKLAPIPGFGTTNFGIVFNAISQFTLKTVTLYPLAAAANTPGTVTIDVLDGTGAIVHTRTVNVIGNPEAQATPNTVTLDFVIQPGNNYKIRPGSRGPGITAILFEPSATAPPGGNYGYPFTIPGVVSITHSTLSAAPGNTPRLDLWYYFYNWSISTGCESPRVPVVATVQPEPTATMSYDNTPYCQNAGNATMTFSGTTGGVFSAPAGLALNTTTGEVNLAASTPGTYTVTYTVAASGICPQFQFTTPITITAAPGATIAYVGSPYCTDFGTANVLLTGTGGGTFSSTAGLSINSSTGAVNLAASSPGVYTVTYTVSAGGGCSSFSTSTQIVISANDSWTGIVSSDWNNPGNWCGGIPTPATNVIIPAFAPNMPALTNGNGNAKNITILSGASLTVGTGGTLHVYGDIYDVGTFNASAGNLAFRGSAIQKIPAFTTNNVTQDGSGGVLLLGVANINGALSMTNGHIHSNGFNINLAGNGTGSASSHIILDGNSVVNVVSLAAGNTRTVPIGINGSSYTPVTFSANGGHVTDNFSVRVDPNVYVDGTSGARFTRDVVDRTWSISESIIGGSNVDLAFGWNAFDETQGFDRARSQVIRLLGGNWMPGPVSASAGIGPYSQSISNLNSFGKFAVRSESLPWTSSGVVYPNPAVSELNVVVNLPQETMVTISIYDSKGSLVMQREVMVNANLSRTTFDISRLDAGTYLVRAASQSNEEIFAERFVKLH